jgi:hypothetical protein
MKKTSFFIWPLLIVLFISSHLWAQKSQSCLKQSCRKPLVCESSTYTCQKVCAKDSDCGQYLSCDKVTNACYSPVQRKRILCKESTHCVKYGHCDFIPGKYREWSSKLQCHPTKAENCRASKVCKTHGLCTLIDGECRAFRDDCKKTESCKRAGGEYCVPINGRCIQIGETVPLLNK